MMKILKLKKTRKKKKVSVLLIEVKSLSCVQLFATPWIVAYQVPPSMEFSRQGCWSGLPFPSPGDVPHPGIKSVSPALSGGFFPTSATWEALGTL